MLASLYPERAGAPFSFSLSVHLSLPRSSLFFLFSSFPLYPSLSLSRAHAYRYFPPSPVYPLLLFQPSPQRSPSSCAFLPYLAPTLRFSSPPPPTVHRFNHECLFLSRSHSNLPTRFLPPSTIFCLSFAARSSSFFSHFRLLSSSYSVPLVVALSLLLHPTRPAFLSLDLCPSR